MGGKSLSICFLSQAFPDTEESYRGIFIKNLAGQLARLGFKIFVITPRIFKVSPKREISGNLYVHRFTFPSNERPLISYKKIPVLRMMIYMVSCLIRTCGVMAKYHCDLIHVHWIHPNGAIGVLAKYLFHVPLIIHARGSDLHTYATKNRFLVSLTRFILRHTDGILCTSQRMKGELLKSFPELDDKKVTVVYNKIDTDMFHPIPEERARTYLNLDRNGLMILFIGNLVAEKGILDLWEIFQSLYQGGRADTASLHVVGKGPLEPVLREKEGNKESRSRIFLHGSARPDRIPFWLNASNLLVLPSENEGMPNVVLEAMGCGIPVLATNVGDVPLFIRDGNNGFLVSRENKREELRVLLEKIFQRPEMITEMKARLQDDISKRKNAWPASKDVTEIYETLLKRRGPAGNHA